MPVRGILLRRIRPAATRLIRYGVILPQCPTLLTCGRPDLSGSNHHRYIIQTAPLLVFLKCSKLSCPRCSKLSCRRCGNLCCLAERSSNLLFRRLSAMESHRCRMASDNVFDKDKRKISLSLAWQTSNLYTITRMALNSSNRRSDQ